MFSNQGIDKVITRVDLQGKGSGYALTALQIDMARTEAHTVQELIDHIQKNIAETGQEVVKNSGYVSIK